MTRVALVLFVALTPVTAHATTSATVALAEWFAAADYVAVVEIVDRRALPNDCGAISVGRVAHWLKGPESAELEFGYQTFFNPGQRYLLFLTRVDRPWARITSTNSFAIRAEAEYRKRCASVHSVPETMQFGLGAMRIDRAAALGGDWAVQLPRGGVRVGATVTCRIHDTPEFTWRRDFVSAPESEIVQVLRMFAARGLDGPSARPEASWHDVTFRNESDVDVVVFARQYRASNYYRDDSSLANDRPDRAELATVPKRGSFTLRLRDYQGGSVTWSARPSTSERDTCSGDIELTCAASGLEVSVSRDRCTAR